MFPLPWDAVFFEALPLWPQLLRVLVSGIFRAAAVLWRLIAEDLILDLRACSSSAQLDPAPNLGGSTLSNAMAGNKEPCPLWETPCLSLWSNIRRLPWLSAPVDHRSQEGALTLCLSLHQNSEN